MGGGGNGFVSGSLHHQYSGMMPHGRNGSRGTSATASSSANLGASPSRKRPAEPNISSVGVAAKADAKPVDDGGSVVTKRPREVSKEFAAAEDHADEALTKEEHRLVVAAIYEIGLKHASPAVIFEHMTEPHQEVTGERLKSHLQKYRKNKDKSREEFLNEYDAWMEKALTVGCAGGTGRFLAPPKAIAEIVGSKKLLGGELPAFLSYSMLQEQNTAAYPVFGSGKSSQAPTIDTRHKPTKGGGPSSERHQVLSFPILTEEERTSPLGACISQVIGLFYPMAKYLMSARENSSETPPSKDPAQGRPTGDRGSGEPPNPRFVERNYAARPERQPQKNRHYNPQPSVKPSSASHNFTSSSQGRGSYPSTNHHHYPYAANSSQQYRSSSNGRHHQAQWLHEG